MRDEESRDRAFGEALVSRLDLATAAVSIMRSTGGTDGALRARRTVEAQLDAGPAGIAEWVYREAAAELQAHGHPDESVALCRIADTSSVLAETEQEWHGRYLGRPLTEYEREIATFRWNGVVLPWGPPPVLGIDGAAYEVSSIAGKGGKGRPSVTVIGHAGGAEAVSFTAVAERDQWYEGRMITRPMAGADPVPLWTSDSSAPDCRTVREERVLAFLLHGGSLDAETRKQLQARIFTTYTRSEIYLAWLAGRPDARAREAGDVREELARRMLRAPAFAARYVGWPFGHQAVSYFDRLKVTPSPQSEAEGAARNLIAADTQAVAAARRAGSWTGAARRTEGRQIPRPCPGEAPDARYRIPQQRRPDDPSPGPMPRL